MGGAHREAQNGTSALAHKHVRTCHRIPTHGQTPQPPKEPQLHSITHTQTRTRTFPGLHLTPRHTGMCGSTCACVRVCVSVHLRVSVCVCARARQSARARTCARVRARARVRQCACTCVGGRTWTPHVSCMTGLSVGTICGGQDRAVGCGSVGEWHVRPTAQIAAALRKSRMRGAPKRPDTHYTPITPLRRTARSCPARGPRCARALSSAAVWPPVTHEPPMTTCVKTGAPRCVALPEGVQAVYSPERCATG